MGIDCGSEVTGYGVVEGDGRACRLVAVGAIRAVARAGADRSQRAPLSERLLKIARELGAVIETHRPDVVAIEEVFFAVNVKSALKLGHVRGVAMLEAARAGLPVSEYSPLEVKLSVVGYGRAEKHQVQQMVKVILGLEAPPASPDAADALAIAICHLNIAATEQKIALSVARART